MQKPCEEKLIFALRNYITMSRVQHLTAQNHGHGQSTKLKKLETQLPSCQLFKYEHAYQARNKLFRHLLKLDK